MKKVFNLMPRVAMVLMMSIWCSCGNSSNKQQVEESQSANGTEMVSATDVAVESTEINPAHGKDFLEAMYKDLYEPWNKDREEESYLSKYFTKEAMRKFYVESDYEEGEFFYCTDFLVNGDISGNASPDYGDKVVSRTIEYESDGWFLVTNIWDVIKKPVKVRLQVKSVDGTYKIVDIGDAKEDNSKESNDASTPISIEEAYKLVDEMIVENYELKGFRSNDNVNRIMEKHGYKKVDSYYIYREFDFSPLFYKNCTVKENSDDVPTPSGDGIASFIGFDQCGLYLSPFTKSSFDDYINQIEKSGAKKVEETESIINYKYNNKHILAFKEGCRSIYYCIIISKD